MFIGYSMTDAQYWRPKPPDEADGRRRCSTSRGSGEWWKSSASDSASMGYGE